MLKRNICPAINVNFNHKLQGYRTVDLLRALFKYLL